MGRIARAASVVVLGAVATGAAATPRARAARPPALVVGDVVVLPTDETMLTADGKGGWGITWQGDRTDPGRLSRAFYAEFPDDYDALSMFTSFDDSSGTAFSAYMYPIRNQVAGIGYGTFDQGKDFGSSARLKTWIDMRHTASLLADPASFMWSVWAQELGHLYLAHLRFSDGGVWSVEMLGRDQSHWSQLLQADASVMDGVLLRDNRDGTFTKLAENLRYSPLDQYAMGLRAQEDVPPFFLLKGATLLGEGRALDARSWVPVGSVMSATAHVITVDDVIEASGVRLPQVEDAPRVARTAVVLLARPGQAADALRAEAMALDALRPGWERRFRDMTDGRGALCTRLRSDCPVPEVAVEITAVRDADGDGVWDPGEDAEIEAVLRSHAGAPALAVGVEAADGSLADAGPRRIVADGLLPDLPVRVLIPVRLGALPCGQGLRLAVRAVTADGFAFFAYRQISVGVGSLVVDGFESPSGWSRAGTGAAGEGAWERGVPEQREGRGLKVQPAAAFEGAAVWGTGLGGGPEAGYNDVDGEEILESPPFSVDGLTDLTLRYAVWWNAAELRDGFLFPSGDPFVVSASFDGGPWREIDRLGRAHGMTNHWRERIAALSGTGKTVRLRFVARDDFPDDTVEATLDRVELLGRRNACPMPQPPEPTGAPDASASDGPAETGGGGCGCGLAGRPVGGALPCVLGLLVTGRRRCRRTRRRACPGCSSRGADDALGRAALRPRVAGHTAAAMPSGASLP